MSDQLSNVEIYESADGQAIRIFARLSAVVLRPLHRSRRMRAIARKDMLTSELAPARKLGLLFAGTS